MRADTKWVKFSESILKINISQIRRNGTDYSYSFCKTLENSFLERGVPQLVISNGNKIIFCQYRQNIFISFEFILKHVNPKTNFRVCKFKNCCYNQTAYTQDLYLSFTNHYRISYCLFIYNCKGCKPMYNLKYIYIKMEEKEKRLQLYTRIHKQLRTRFFKRLPLPTSF